MTIKVTLLSGCGRYADPYHAFSETSSAIARILDGLGADITVRGDVEEALGDLPPTDLLVFNVANPSRHGLDSDTFTAARSGFIDYVTSGRSVLSFHVSATSFPHMPEWEEAVGGRWISGTSMHPPIGSAAVMTSVRRHPITAGVPNFFVWDERYTNLRHRPDITVLAEHEHEGRRHPLLWTYENPSGLAVYDALGHQRSSFESKPHRRLIEQSYRWLLT